MQTSSAPRYDSLSPCGGDPYLGCHAVRFEREFSNMLIYPGEQGLSRSHENGLNSVIMVGSLGF